jgi:hypothetical protein
MNPILQKAEDRKPSKITFGYLAGVAIIAIIAASCGAVAAIWIVWEKLKTLGVVDGLL